MLREVAWGELDVLVVDLPPGTGDAQLTIAQQTPLAGAVIVCTPQDLALLDARRGIAMFRRVNVPLLGLIENMSNFCCPACNRLTPIFGHGGARAEAEKLGIPFLGEIPLAMQLRETSDDGRPVVATEPDGVHARHYIEIARNVLCRHRRRRPAGAAHRHRVGVIEQVMDKPIPVVRPGKSSFPRVTPDPADRRLTEAVAGIDQAGGKIEIRVPVERALTLYLNAQEIVTMMTINDYPEYLALGYLLNQNMLRADDVVTEVVYDDDLQVVVVYTEHGTNFEEKLKKKTLTSGCAQGTAFGDLMEAIEGVVLPQAELRTSWLYQMTQAINTDAVALSRGRRNSRLRAVRERRAGLLHGGRRPAQCGRQDRGLGLAATTSTSPTRSCTRPDGSPRRW